MKTVITVTNTYKIGIDEYAYIKTSKIFDDNSTILEIKQWLIEAKNSKAFIDNIGLSGVEISDLIE